MLRELGDRLRRAGLTQAALLAWAGTHRLSLLPSIIPALAARPPTPASSVLALFVAGADIPRARLRALPIDELLAFDLVEIGGSSGPTSETKPLAFDHVRATTAVLPLEQTLVACDRFDAPSSRELVLPPDDSSYHLASAIPSGRRERWIDLATGSAFAPLARPALASTITGIDLNPRAVQLARLGAGLSGCAHVGARCADIGEVADRAQLVTCNAPILDDPDPTMWRSTDRAFFDRMWSSARACVEPGGEVIVHCVVDGIPAHIDGDVAIVVYTPPGERAYAITWWSPDAPARRSLRHRELTAARPHLDANDRHA